MTHCPYCEQPLAEGTRIPWDEPVTRAVWDPEQYHYECLLRKRWQEWKSIVAEMNDVDSNKIPNI